MDIYLTSLTLSSIQTAVDSCNEGDILHLPEGNETWTTRLYIIDKAITLKGAGKYKTHITSQMPNEIIKVTNNSSRITELNLIRDNPDGDWILFRSAVDWRIDHCLLTNLDYETCNISALNSESDPSPRGLVDHNILENGRVVVYGSSTLMANTIWSQPLNLGTYNAVFVENNFFDRKHGNAIDANYGGRYVFRNNVTRGAYLECHAVQMTNRAGRSWEIYNNEIRQTLDGDIIWTPIFLRGGTGVVYNNKVVGSWSQSTITVDNRRSCNALGDGGLCDGSSLWDGNESEQQGYLCRDQIGASTDEFYWDYTGNPTNVPLQAKDPMYVWNNYYVDTLMTVYRHNCAITELHIQPDRDYYEETKRPSYTPYTYPFPTIQQQGSLKTFVVHNHMTSNLELIESPFRVLRSGDIADFTIDENDLDSIILPDQTSSFTVRFAPLSVGVKTMTITIPNNDSNNDPYTITLTGNGIESQEINIKIDGETVLHSGVYDFGDVAI